MKRYYDAQQRRLVFVNQAATAAFWDDHWLARDLEQRLAIESASTFHASVTKKFLPPNQATRLLDGGCGTGGIVMSLRRAGYDASGIDTAVKTITAAKQLNPDLPLVVGDVQNLPFEDASFDGYWSLGVIEHNYDGYTPIIEEARRIIRPGGFLFITFPYFNLLRRTRAAISSYPVWPAEPSEKLLEHFYQFALNYHDTVAQISRNSFKLRLRKPIDGFKGIKDELPLLHQPLQFLYENHSQPATAIKNILSVISAPATGHVMLCVFQRL